MAKDKELAAYLKEATSWDKDINERVKKSEKRAWFVAGCACFVAATSVIAIAMLTPLKSTEPYVVRVDNASGVTDIVRVLKDDETNYDETVNRYFAQQYVKYRENYSRDLAEEYYSNVGLMSGTSEKTAYYNWFNPKNPMSPLTLYSDKAKVRIKIKSTTFVNKNTALVRYMKEVERTGSQKQESSHWASTIVFTYSGKQVDDKSREVNPLGFQVKEYRSDSEVVQSEALPTQPQQPKKQFGASAGFEKQGGQQ